MRSKQILRVFLALFPSTAVVARNAGQRAVIFQTTKRSWTQQQIGFGLGSVGRGGGGGGGGGQQGQVNNLLLQQLQVRGGYSLDHSSDVAAIDEVRGGGGGDNKNQRGSTNPLSSSSSTSTSGGGAATGISIPEDKYIIGSVSVIVLGLLAYKYREALRPFMDKQYIQERTLSILKQLEQSPASIPIYILGMALWEFFGLSTIPVETAAGMVFGPIKGMLASGIGKLTGAYTAFALGRTLLANQVRTKLSKNKVWNVLDKSTDEYSPLAVGLLMKFSCFPEFIKNFGCSVLDMNFATFATATAMHGLMFTTLWTLLGVDAAARLEQPDLPANVTLQVVLVLAALIGLVGSPLLMAWWIRDMKRIASEQG